MDGESIPTNVYDMAPNDLAFYHMAGKLNEWVRIFIRPLSFQDFDDLTQLETYRGF